MLTVLLANYSEVGALLLSLVYRPSVCHARSLCRKCRTYRNKFEIIWSFLTHIKAIFTASPQYCVTTPTLRKLRLADHILIRTSQGTTVCNMSNGQLLMLGTTVWLFFSRFFLKLCASYYFFMNYIGKAIAWNPKLPLCDISPIQHACWSNNYNEWSPLTRSCHVMRMPRKIPVMKWQTRPSLSVTYWVTWFAVTPNDHWFTTNTTICRDHLLAFCRWSLLRHAHYQLSSLLSCTSASSDWTLVYALDLIYTSETSKFKSILQT